MRVTKALTVDPLDFGARLFQGGLSLIQGKFKDAIYHFRLAAESRDTSSALYTNGEFPSWGPADFLSWGPPFGSPAEPKATILTRLSFSSQVFVL